MTRLPTDPADAFAELGRIKLGEVGLDDVLQRVAELAKRVLPTPVEVSVTLVRGDSAHGSVHRRPGPRLRPGPTSRLTT